MPWSGSRQTLVAHSACACTIGHRRRGSRWLRRVCSRIESSAAPYTSFWRWSKAPLPTRTGMAPAYPESSSGVDSDRSRRPSIPYMICSAAVVVGLEVGDELHELLGLPVEVQVVQRLQREGRVAQPRVAVVPVALAARGLRQRRRERRDRGARRHVREPLDRERRALDRFAPAVIGDARAAQPVAPEACGRGDALAASLDGSPARRAPRPRTARSRACSPCLSVCRPLTRSPSMPTARSVRSRIVCVRAARVRDVAVVRGRSTAPARGRSRRPARR